MITFWVQSDLISKYTKLSLRFTSKITIMKKQRKIDNP